MILIDSKIIKYKGYHILQENTNRGYYIYTISNKDNSYLYKIFRSLKDIKNYINLLEGDDKND